MGVVYKARQEGLDRLVALKMVLAGAHADALQLARFHTEAQAVARLQHPNIVQIHEVGAQDGLPYFSLEFVDGGPLDKRIGGKSQPPREAAQLVATLARAIHCAHERGIIHRDLKPANILMTAEGVPKITDFGLAKRLEGDSSQTRSGTIMGTPSYMPPEQARGDLNAVGPKSDQYALGAILYELLTGRPPFLAASPMETVMQVTRSEPVPPSRLQAWVPRDLETICLKCLQKEPSRRYNNCFELAEDLDRFLAGEAIRARPVGAIERTWRWCRRNPRVALLTAAVFSLLVLGVAFSSVAAVVIKRERDQKERQREAADTARVAAERARRAADDARRISDEQVALALETVQTLIHKVQDQIGNTPQTQQLRKDLLATAADGLKKIGQHARGTSSTDVAYSMAAVEMKLGSVFRGLGETEEAFGHVRACHQINLAQAKAHPDSERAKRNLAASYTVLAEMSLELRRDPKSSLENYRKALELRQEVFASPHGTPDPELRKRDEQALAETYTRVGASYYDMGDLRPALEEFRKALELREGLARAHPDDGILQDLARSSQAVGEVSLRLGQDEEGQKALKECLKLRERLSRAHPNDLGLKYELAKWLGALGEIVSQHFGEWDEARRHNQRWVDLMNELSSLDPKNVEYRVGLGTAYYQLASSALKLGDARAADANFRESLRIRRARADAEPNNARRQIELVLVLPHCGEDAKADELAQRLLREYPKDVVVLIAAGCTYATASSLPRDPDLHRRYADRAFEALRALVGLGFRDTFFFETDPDLDPLRDDPRFRALIESIKHR
jgi:serine/threonine-protein kinase